MRAIHDLNLISDVIFLGYIPDNELPAIYNAADLFVYPSYYEGFGLPPLEAMASGCPVISSNVSSLPEVIGGAGILINPDNINELFSSILTLISNQDLRREYIEKGLDRAKQFSWERTAQETLRVYYD
jgi:glycosyltransferase involved in cell wall biosynthesis